MTDVRYLDKLAAAEPAPLPTDPVEIARHALELLAVASPGPWNACKDGRCSCLTLWSGAEYPIAQLNSGEWGDEYPVAELVDAHEGLFDLVNGGLLPGTKAIVARHEFMPYGAIPEGYPQADLRLIAFARSALEVLAREVLKDHEHPCKPAPASIEIVGPESFIADAAAPLLNYADQLEAPEARKHVLRAVQLLDQRFSDLR